MKPLRPYQQEAFQAIRETVAQGVNRLVVQAPTGSGKTRLAAEIGLGVQRKNNRLVFVVPAISLIDQTVEMFFAEGVRDIGVIQQSHPMTDWSKPIQIASIQTIRSRGAYPEASIVLFDEVHQLHKEHIRWLDHADWKGIPFIGLSATPWTRGLGKYFHSLLVMSRTKELIKDGFLAPFQVFASDHPDLSDVKTVAGDYHEGQLSGVMQDTGLIANVIETYKEKWNKGNTFCFGVDCAHAKMLQQRFHDAGISCAYQDAGTTLNERAAIKRGFHNGTYDVVCNIGTLTTGVDWDVRCLILARPTKSEMLFVQIIGRALRTAPGKDKAIILDHTSTTERLGFVTDIHHERLSHGKMDSNKTVKRTPPLPKPCPECTCLIPVGAKTCPCCGFERVVTSKVFERDGRLVEFTGDFRVKDTTNPHYYPYTDSEKMRFYAQLLGYATLHSYNPGWAFHKYTEKFRGEKPPYAWKKLTPMTPGPEVSNWIKYTQIMWARSKANNGNKRQDGAAPGFI